MNDWKLPIIGLILGLITWGANTIYNNLTNTMQENRDSIQALIQLHIKP